MKIILTAVAAWFVAVAGHAAPLNAADSWLKADNACWTKVPKGQADRIKSILRTWPEGVRRRAGEKKAFPCDIVLAISFADHAIARHIKDNPLSQSGGPTSADTPAGDVIHNEDDPKASLKEMPGYLVDRSLRTIFTANLDNISRRDPRRRDCIGMQSVAINALSKLPPDVGIESHMLVLGNESLGRFSAHAGAYLIGANPVDNGVHHVVGLWPKLRRADSDGAIPEYAVILDYWLYQDAASKEDILSKQQFEAKWDAQIQAGALRVEDGD